MNKVQPEVSTIKDRLELRHLRTLQAIRHSKSLAEAANKLHLTASALSHQLKEMEQKLGNDLLIRKSRPPRFTTAGLRLLKLADQILPVVRATERDLTRLGSGEAGRLHIAIECHSCFQWLMPCIDDYRQHWPNIEVDLSAGFNFAPMPALIRGDLDLVVTSDTSPIEGISYIPLFRYEILLALSERNPLAEKTWIEAEDLQNQVLINYPVDRQRLDIFCHFLEPADVEPAGLRTSELTVMMLQLVASNRGVAALPNWALDEYLQRGYVQARRLKPPEKNGLWSVLYAAVREEQLTSPFMKDFLLTAKDSCFENLNGIEMI
ncbi:LysR family transcriptional regulator [Pelagibaculum spongiae]|uniref:HTH-type transcriptional regulator MetR n=1 Tax=Pelagibaculum spongiae TaxID=2080658 RepID=A0A2V1H047_9GAMM|nr:LysR family transcriptional regulator [Pelagibaculum spongiae]PVZ70564.1 LysR family transcriptional regulator [Pelagibaculum spongiae]